jgi:hypothetical protein
VQDDEARTSDYVYKPKAYTLCLPFKPKIPNGKGLKIYTYSGVTTEDGVTTVSFTEISTNGTMHANYPYYLVMEGEEAVNVYGSGASVDVSLGGGGGTLTKNNYDFTWTYVTIPNETLYDPDQPKYILQSDGNWHKVPQNEPKAYVPPFRAHFRASTASGTRALMTGFGNDDTTGISQTVVRTIDNDGTQYYYDLNGRRLPGRPQHGIYIHNGKKYSAK